MKLLALAMALAASAAGAQGKPTLIDAPLDVKTAVTDAQQAALQDEFRQSLARNTGILLPTRSNWKAAIAALKRQDCDIRNECLRQLATTGGTLYALYASVERNAAGSEVSATGRVVNQDGIQVRPPVSVTVKRKGSFEEAAREALGQLLARLELEKLSPVLTPPPAEAKPAPVAELPKAEPLPFPPPPPPPPAVAVSAPPPEPPTSGGRVAGFVFGGLAVASGAVAAGFGASAASARGGLPSNGQLADESQVRIQQSVNQQATVALATGVAAAVLAITSVSLLAASPRQTPAVGLAPVPGGAAMVVGGRF